MAVRGEDGSCMEEKLGCPCGLTLPRVEWRYAMCRCGCVVWASVRSCWGRPKVLCRVRDAVRSVGVLLCVEMVYEDLWRFVTWCRRECRRVWFFVGVRLLFFYGNMMVIGHKKVYICEVYTVGLQMGEHLDGVNCNWSTQQEGATRRCAQVGDYLMVLRIKEGRKVGVGDIPACFWDLVGLSMGLMLELMRVATSVVGGGGPKKERKNPLKNGPLSKKTLRGSIFFLFRKNSPKTNTGNMLLLLPHFPCPPQYYK